ncbi:MAG: TRAP transporter substrate-binding protein DctP [Burkholderiaceae bacterium]
MKSRISRIAFGALIALSTTLVHAEELVAKLSYHWAPKHPAAINAQKYADAVNARLKGKFRIDVFPAGQLFGIREVMGAIAAGSVELGGVVGVVSFPSIDRNYAVTTFPGFFTSFEQQREFFTKDPVGKGIWDGLLAKTRSMVIAHNPVGPVAIYSTKKSLDNVESLAGLKARVLTNPDRARWKGVGVGKMISLPTREVYTSLQNGTIDTVSTVPAALKAYSWWEFLNAGQLPYNYYSDAYIMANKPWFDSLPKDIQAVLLEEGAKTGVTSTKEIMAASEQMNKEFVERGGKITVLEGAELEKMRKLEADKVEPALAEEVDKEVFVALKKFVGQK